MSPLIGLIFIDYEYLHVIEVVLQEPTPDTERNTQTIVSPVGALFTNLLLVF